MQQGYVKVAAAVPYVKVADCYYNVERISEMVHQADAQGVEIVTFPELSVTGYTCGDLFLQPFLLDEANAALCQLVRDTADTRTLVIVGMPVRVEEKLFNSAVVFQQGHILGAIPKTYLPNYRELQEKRWFSPSDVLQYKTVRIGEHTVPIGRNILFRSGRVGIGIEICEDMWTPYTPGTRLSLYGAHIIFNLSASNENAGKHNYLRSIISGLSSQGLCGYVYVSCGYGESSTDLVYTGKAFISEIGKIVKEMKRFEYCERMIVSDIDVSHVQTERLLNSSFKSAVSHFTQEELTEIPFALRSEEESAPVDRPIERNPFMPTGVDPDERCEEMFQIQVCGLVQRLRHMKAEHAVIGISGGLDSTLALLVTVRAFDILGLPHSNIIGVTMPGFGTSTRTRENAHKMMRHLGVTLQEIDITEACMQHFAAIGHDPEVHDTTYENVQARERTQLLMDIANRYNAPVIGTGDLSEIALGWCTYNGDHMSMYSVNATVAKTSVALIIDWHARVLSHGDEVLKKTLLDVVDTPISPELIPGVNGDEPHQKTQEAIGPYELHDFFIYHFLFKKNQPSKIFYLASVAFEGIYPPSMIKRYMLLFFRRFFSQQYKRNCMPDGPKVGAVSLSPRGEWRMPSDAVSSMWIREIEQLPED